MAVSNTKQTTKRVHPCVGSTLLIDFLNRVKPKNRYSSIENTEEEWTIEIRTTRIVKVIQKIMRIRVS